MSEIFTILLFFGGILFVVPVSFLIPGFLEVEIKFIFLGRPGRAPSLVDVALQQLLQTRGLFLVLFEEVACLAEVILQVVEFAGAVAQGDQFPVALADGQAGGRLVDGRLEPAS